MTSIATGSRGMAVALLLGLTVNQLAGEEEAQAPPQGMVEVPAGEFIMGDPNLLNAGPAHNVHLDGFAIDKLEITVAEYDAFVKATGGKMPTTPAWGWRPKDPVVNVDWTEAAAYCKSKGKRLPTEAEWEKAARGVEARTFPWDSETEEKIDLNSDIANVMGDQDKHATTAPVGSYPLGASVYGALDMAGNVWEWCADWYGPKYYKTSPAKNPVGPDKATDRVFRGGAWNNSIYVLRSANRSFAPPDYRDNSLGFRCAR